jgi:hypothetical protein
MVERLTLAHSRRFQFLLHKREEASKQAKAYPTENSGKQSPGAPEPNSLRNSGKENASQARSRSNKGKDRSRSNKLNGNKSG